jgi:hypothetical protein
MAAFMPEPGGGLPGELASTTAVALAQSAAATTTAAIR